jgi:hypothetical protein
MIPDLKVTYGSDKGDGSLQSADAGQPQFLDQSVLQGRMRPLDANPCPCLELAQMTLILGFIRTQLNPVILSYFLASSLLTWKIAYLLLRTQRG